MDNLTLPRLDEERDIVRGRQTERRDGRDCVDDVGRLFDSLWSEALDRIVAASSGAPTTRPEWLPMRTWAEACQIGAKVRGDVGCLLAILGFVEDEAFVEASRRHRCRTHPYGIHDGLRTTA